MSDLLNTQFLKHVWIPPLFALVFFSNNAMGAIEFSPDWNAYGHCTTVSAENTCAWSWTVTSRRDTTCDYPFALTTSMPFHFRTFAGGIRMEVQFGSTNLFGMVTEELPFQFSGDDSYIHHIQSIETFYPAYMDCQISTVAYASLSGSVAQPVSFAGSCYWSQRDLYGGRVCSGIDDIVAAKLPPGYVEIPPNGGDKNLDIVAIEVNQSVQDWSNSAPLIANKSAVVRVYIQSRANNGPYAKGVEGELLGKNAITGQPLSPSSAGRSGTIIAPPQADVTRSLTEFNMNFTLPDTWLQGNVRLVLNPANAAYIFNCSGNTETFNEGCATVVNFQQSSKPQIKFIGIQWEGIDGRIHTPTLAHAIDLKESLRDAFPVADVNATYAWMSWPYLGLPDLVEVNAKLSEIKRLDCVENANDCQRIYYGFIPGMGISGLASEVGGDVASGIMPTRKFTAGRHTHSHEIGHTLSRHHSVHSILGQEVECVSGLTGEYYYLAGINCYPGDQFVDFNKLGFCGEVASASEAPDYPYLNDIAGLNDALYGHLAGFPWPTLGAQVVGNTDVIYGHDFNAAKYGFSPIVDPKFYFDLMSYCSSTYTLIDLWPSLYTYNSLRTQINTLWPLASANNLSPNQLVTAAVGADYLDVVGTVDYPSGAVKILYIQPITFTGDLPVPSLSGLYTLRLQNQAGDVIQDIAFDPIKQHGRGDTKTAGLFVVPVAVNPAITRISVRLGDLELAAKSASLTAPSVEVSYPNGGEIITDEVINLSWVAADADNDDLQYTIQFSPDNGISWQTLNLGWTKTNIEINRQQLQKTTQGLIRVIVSDGFYSSEDASDAVFSINGTVPKIVVSAPLGNPLISAEQLLDAKVDVWDAEDGLIPESNIKWVSNLDGEIASGRSPQFKADLLSEGQHYITISATDSDNNIGRANSRILVWRNVPALYTDLVIKVYEYPKPLAPGEEGSYTLMIVNDGPAVADPVYLFDYLATGAVALTAAVDPSVTCQGHDDFVICGLGDLLINEVQFITITAQANQNGEILGIGVVTGTIPDLFLLNNRTLSEQGAEPTVDINLSANATVIDNSVSYKFTLVNNGTEAATAINLLSPVLTSGFSLVSASNGCSEFGNFIKCGYAILFPGEQSEFTVETKATLDGDYSVSTTVKTLELDTNFSNNQALTEFQISGNQPKPGDGSGGGGGSGGGCFIATAAYGSSMMEEVRYLRAFRDEFLLTNPIGGKLVEWYYQLSPPLADFLRQHDTVRSVVRTDLKPWVWLSRLLVSEEGLARQTENRP